MIIDFTRLQLDKFVFTISTSRQFWWPTEDWVCILHQRDGDVPIDRLNSADCSKDSGEYLFYRAIQNLVNWQEDITLQHIERGFSCIYGTTFGEC